jgi:hypothetical protein
MMRQCKEFNIPTDWMLDNNLISKVNDLYFSVLYCLSVLANIILKSSL